MGHIRMFDDYSEYPAVIKIVGVGGAGGNAVNRMVNSHIRGVEFIVSNTDAQALRSSDAGLKLQIGKTLTRGLGVGGDPSIGKKSAEEDKEIIKESLMGADMVFITAGMGGGTGTGAAPVVAEIAKEIGALTVGVVTKPFMFEGKIRSRHAEDGINELRDKVDTLIVIPNQRLFAVIDDTTPAHLAWDRVDEVLKQAIQSISDVITSTGIVNVDFNDVKAIMTGAGQALMGLGESNEEGRAIHAARMAVTSPLLEDVSIQGAKGLLINITGGEDLTMLEINEAMTLIFNTVSPEANVYFGQVFDKNMTGKIKITVIATNFSEIKTEEPKDDLFEQEKKNVIPHLLDKENIDSIEEPAFLRAKRNKRKL
ncbi:cell division protein FtsZ [bacterium]